MTPFSEGNDKLLAERITGFLLGIGLGTALGFFLRHPRPHSGAGRTARSAAHVPAGR